MARTAPRAIRAPLELRGPQECRVQRATLVPQGQPGPQASWARRVQPGQQVPQGRRVQLVSRDEMAETVLMAETVPPAPRAQLEWGAPALPEPLEVLDAQAAQGNLAILSQAPLEFQEPPGLRGAQGPRDQQGPLAK